MTNVEVTDVPVEFVWCTPLRGSGGEPPYKLEFAVHHTDKWPTVLLTIQVDGQQVFATLTEEPRLKALAAWLQSETS